jgi:hypothetical protein
MDCVAGIHEREYNFHEREYNQQVKVPEPAPFLIKEI